MCTCMWCGDSDDYKDGVVLLISDRFVYTTDATNLYHAQKNLLFHLQIMIQYCLYLLMHKIQLPGLNLCMLY